MSSKNNILYFLFILAFYLVTAVKCTSNFTRYDYYPEYCSTPDQMLNRTIPSLGSSNDTKFQLLQVISLIRHGSRAPNDIEPCWEGYQDSESDTSSWDCNLSTVASTPRIKNGNEFLRKDRSTNGNTFLFEKIYDEGEDPYFHLKLNGTCKKGDLLDEAFMQEFSIGEIARDAYITTKIDNMMLFYGISDDIFSEPWTYFRTDDIPRTIMSGQIFLQGLFQDQLLLSNDGKISTHTSSHKTDILEPAAKHCPKLKNLIDEAESSAEYQLGIHSHEAKSLNRLYEKKLNGKAQDLVDCLMTTICSDRTLPKLLDDFDGDEHGRSNFIKFSNFESWKNNYIYDYNEAAYSKVASGPLWSDIISKMNKTLSSMPSSFESSSSLHYSTIKNRFILYSVHDSTITTLLAAIGKNVAIDYLSWPPYASMLNFEIYTDDVNLLFRIIYNGKILTHVVNGCSKVKELCDLQVLFDLVNSFTGTKDELCTEDDFTS